MFRPFFKSVNLRFNILGLLCCSDLRLDLAFADEFDKMSLIPNETLLAVMQNFQPSAVLLNNPHFGPQGKFFLKNTVLAGFRLYVNLSGGDNPELLNLSAAGRAADKQHNNGGDE